MPNKIVCLIQLYTFHLVHPEHFLIRSFCFQSIHPQLSRQHSVYWVADDYLFSSDALSMFRFDTTFENYSKCGLA